MNQKQGDILSELALLIRQDLGKNASSPAASHSGGLLSQAELPNTEELHSAQYLNAKIERLELQLALLREENDQLRLQVSAANQNVLRRVLDKETPLTKHEKTQLLVQHDKAHWKLCLWKVDGLTLEVAQLLLKEIMILLQLSDPFAIAPTLRKQTRLTGRQPSPLRKLRVVNDVPT